MGEEGEEAAEALVPTCAPLAALIASWCALNSSVVLFAAEACGLAQK